VIVVDASAALDVLLQTPAAGIVQARLIRAGEILHAPHLIDAEVAHVLRKSELAGRASPERCREALADWSRFPIARHPHDFLLTRVWELRTNLTAYDAIYVALAETLGIPLVTRDSKLARSHGHDAQIEFLG